MLIDTHCHLDFVLGQTETLKTKTEDLLKIKVVIDRAYQSGVTKIINVGCDILSSQNGLFLSETFENVFATIGIHPTECNSDWQNGIKDLRTLPPRHPRAKLVAVGEIGIDYYHKPFNAQKQKDAFAAQIELALELGLPISVHTRGDGAADDVLKTIEPYLQNNVRGVIHCFQQSLDFAQTTTKWGFYLGVDGPIDYPKNTQLRQIIREIGLDKIVLETDAPFLPPQRYRGKPNESAYILNIAEALSTIFDVDLKTVAETTSRNASQLFKI